MRFKLIIVKNQERDRSSLCFKELALWDRKQFLCAYVKLQLAVTEIFAPLCKELALSTARNCILD